MSAHRTAFYDPNTETLWVARAFTATSKRMTKDEVFALTAILKAGKTDDDQPVKAINVLFRQEEAAAHNYQTLAFVDIGAYYELGGNRIRYVPEGGELEVDVRADFGITLPEE